MSNSLTYYLEKLNNIYRHSETVKNYISILCLNSINIQDLIQQIKNGFIIDTAVGSQLDIIGLWVGVSRYVNSKIIDVYFEFDNIDVKALS